MASRKLNRKQREARRQAHAAIFQEGFEKGWELRGEVEAAKTRCQRMTVRVMGVDRYGTVRTARNYTPHPYECTGEPGNCGCVHAEHALLQVMPEPKIVILSHSPCLNCAKLLVDAGVEAVYYVNEYRLPDGIAFLRENNVKIYRIEG